MTSDILKRAAEAVEKFSMWDVIPYEDDPLVDGLLRGIAAARTLIPDMAAAISERDAELKRLTARAEAAEAMVDRLADAVIGAQNIVLHCEIADGSCCCGEEMARHSNPIDCGHQPIDHGQYYADKWLEGSADLIAAHAAMNEGR